MHSLQLGPTGDAEQNEHSWSSRSGNVDSAFCDHTPASSGLATWQDHDMILSPSPPPQPTLAQRPIQATETTQVDPRIASLKSIFPDFDDAVILSVLESTDYDHDRALDVLLGMNDPSFVPSTVPSSQSPNRFQSAPSSDAQRLSQEALDERLARRLAMEEEQAVNQPWQSQGTDGTNMYQGYQPRRGRNSWGGQPQGQPQTQGQGGRDTMSEFQEGFNRIAESGKKTFSSIVSKVRAKMQEFEQGQGWSGSQTPPPEQSASASNYPSYTSDQQQGSRQGAYAQPYQSRQHATPQRQTSQPQLARTSGTYQSSPPLSGVLRPAVAEPVQSANTQQPSYYDPNARGYDLYGDDEEIQINDRTTPSATLVATSSAAAPATTPGHAIPPQTDGTTSPPPPSNMSSLPSYSSLVSPSPNSRLPSTSPPPRSSSTPVGVDFSKLGLLPKRPISLVRPESPPVSGAGAGAGVGASVSAPRVAASHSESTTDSSTDREQLEFVENPFEDPK